MQRPDIINMIILNNKYDDISAMTKCIEMNKLINILPYGSFIYLNASCHGLIL